ncbi:hypothetical protein BDA96_01G516100 [Sorghum bicolor]|uniref:AB hydrolase-1 domain-containing protein n=1 Tax=Sorghum bicolor TaxID=4558 RepID=A0A921S5L3_SORBI|nr:hypothetical protein BDA96_01G516100 [Sorghum bicolor]
MLSLFICPAKQHATSLITSRGRRRPARHGRMAVYLYTHAGADAAPLLPAPTPPSTDLGRHRVLVLSLPSVPSTSMRISSVPSSMRATASSASATALAAAMNMKQPPHGASTLFALLSLSLLLLRLLLRLRLAAFRDAALSLHLLARLRLRPVLLRLHDGASSATTLRVWCPAAPSSKPPLLLLHGFGGDAKWTWARNLPRLSRHFHVYAPDLVFFGAQSRSASPLRSVAFQARCAAEAMRLLGVPRYDVAGISYGGFVAYRMAAAEASDAVGRLVIMTTGVAATPGEMRAMAAREDRTVEEALLPNTAEGLRFLVRRSMHRPPPWMPDFVLDDFIQLMYVDQKRERAELLHELLKTGAGFDTLPALTQETLLIWGDKDQVFPVDLGHRLHRLLGERSRLEIVSDAGHALQLEGADHVNRFIKSFLLDERIGLGRK